MQEINPGTYFRTHIITSDGRDGFYIKYCGCFLASVSQGELNWELLHELNEDGGFERYDEFRQGVRNLAMISVMMAGFWEAYYLRQDRYHPSRLEVIPKNSIDRGACRHCVLVAQCAVHQPNAMPRK
jgi:hypothetical protein